MKEACVENEGKYVGGLQAQVLAGERLETWQVLSLAYGARDVLHRTVVDNGVV